MKFSEIQAMPEYNVLFNKLGDVIEEAIGNGTNGAVLAFALSDCVSSVIASLATQVVGSSEFLDQWMAILIQQIEDKRADILEAGGIEAKVANPGSTARVFSSPANTTRH